MSLNYSKTFLEWCEVMGKIPNDRDFIIFHAGYNFALADVKNKGENNE
jgi:hypothetical protein